MCPNLFKRGCWNGHLLPRRFWNLYCSSRCFRQPQNPETSPLKHNLPLVGANCNKDQAFLDHTAETTECTRNLQITQLVSLASQWYYTRLIPLNFLYLIPESFLPLLMSFLLLLYQPRAHSFYLLFTYFMITHWATQTKTVWSLLIPNQGNPISRSNLLMHLISSS